jgi:hypothetical protein|tara:strand:- start:897 stop:1460 length:564 start_codon:yes stop_codon:yes gene_type:complete
MALDYGDSSKSTKNVSLQPVTILDIEAFYDTKQHWQEKADDVGVSLTLDIGRDFNPTMYIGGLHKVDQMSGNKTYGSSVRVKILMQAIGLGKGIDDFVFKKDQDGLEKAIGREFLRLSFKYIKPKDGSIGWRDWHTVAKVGQEDALLAKFKKAIDEGWVKNVYKPESINDTNGDSPMSGPWDKNVEV